MNKQVFPANTESPDEIITALCGRKGDVGGHLEMKYRGVVLDVYRDLNLYTLKYAVRQLLPVDRKTNSIIVPDKYMFFSSLSFIDECNMINTIAVNNNLTDDIIDMSLNKDCECECQCKNDLCGQIKYYEPIIEDSEELMPDSTYKTFTSITRKKLMPGGKLVIERTFPVAKFGADNEFTDVTLETEIEELCQLEVASCGCVKDTPDNCKKLNECCNATTFATDCGCTSCAIPSGKSFNFNEEGNRIVLPSEFPYSKALLRFYIEADVKNMRIPTISKETFIYGLEAFTLPFDDSQPRWRIKDFEDGYSARKAKNFTLLNRFSMKQFKQVTSPKIIMPS